MAYGLFDAKPLPELMLAWNGPPGIIFCEIFMEIHTFSFMRMHLKLWSAYFSLSLNLLKVVIASWWHFQHCVSTLESCHMSNIKSKAWHEMIETFMPVTCLSSWGCRKLNKYGLVNNKHIIIANNTHKKWGGRDGKWREYHTNKTRKVFYRALLIGIQTQRYKVSQDFWNHQGANIEVFNFDVGVHFTDNLPITIKRFNLALTLILMTIANICISHGSHAAVSCKRNLWRYNG